MQSSIKSKLPVIVFLLSILTAIFWYLGQLINVYRFAVVGAIFEILWLPMIALLIGLPIICFIHWRKDKFIHGSLYLYAMLILLSILIFMIIKSLNH